MVLLKIVSLFAEKIIVYLIRNFIFTFIYYNSAFYLILLLKMFIILCAAIQNEKIHLSEYLQVLLIPLNCFNKKKNHLISH